MGFPKVSDKYPHPKTKFVSPTRSSESSASLLKKGSLVWLVWFSPAGRVWI